MRIVVLGAGYAGVTVARYLDTRLPPEIELVVVDERSNHLVQHELHRLVRFPDLADTIQVPLVDLFDRAVVETAHVESVDHNERVVHLGDGDAERELEYDYAVVSLGAETAFYDLPGLEEHALPLKRPADAVAIRESFLETCATGGTAVVGGAGLSGIQVAGELAALADEEEADVDVVLIEQMDSVAPTFPKHFRRAVHGELEEQGVTVRTGTTVERATASNVETDAGTIDYDTLVWTGGISGSQALGGDRPAVRSDLRLDEHTFVVGDAARIVDADGEAVPASASAALREARVVADNLLTLVSHERTAAPDDFKPRLDQYRFEVPGWIVSVGDGTVAQVGPTVLRGSAALAMKTTVGAGHLSSIGAVRQAADLVEAELGPRPSPRDLDVDDAVDELSDTIDVTDAADVVDGLARREQGDDSVRAQVDPIEIEIPVDDEADETDETDEADGTSGDDDDEGDEGGDGETDDTEQNR